LCIRRVGRLRLGCFGQRVLLCLLNAVQLDIVEEIRLGIRADGGSPESVAARAVFRYLRCFGYRSVRRAAHPFGKPCPMLADVALVSGVAHFVCGLSAEMLKRLIEIHDNLVFRPKVKVKLRRIPHAVLSRRVRKFFRISRGRHRVAQCFRIYDMRTVTVFAGGVMPDDDLRLESAEIFDLPFEEIVVAVSCVCKHLHSALAGFRIEVGKYADHGVISDARRPKSVELLMRSYSYARRNRRPAPPHRNPPNTGALRQRKAVRRRCETKTEADPLFRTAYPTPEDRPAAFRR